MHPFQLNQRVQRIGIYGGSFDPIHNGHLLVAQAAREEMQLDRIIFVPAAQSPFKPGSQPAPAHLRLRLLRLALAGWSFAGLDLQEIERGGISYSVDTTRFYARQFPGAELFYLIGQDHVSQLSKWKEAAELGRLLNFIVIPRPGEKAIPMPAGFEGRQLTGFPLGVSSSQIRERIQAGQPIDHLVPRAVAEAIRNNHLYL